MKKRIMDIFGRPHTYYYLSGIEAEIQTIDYIIQVLPERKILAYTGMDTIDLFCLADKQSTWKDLLDWLVYVWHQRPGARMFAGR